MCLLTDPCISKSPFINGPGAWDFINGGGLLIPGGGYSELRHFRVCDDPVCPDPVWKLSIEARQARASSMWPRPQAARRRSCRRAWTHCGATAPRSAPGRKSLGGVGPERVVETSRRAPLVSALASRQRSPRARAMCATHLQKFSNPPTYMNNHN